MSFTLVGSYKWHPERSEFIGVVAKQEDKVLTVLTIGSEPDEKGILAWIEATIAEMRATGRDDVQAPDMYDRATLN
jgi:hypothetical protein